MHSVLMSRLQSLLNDSPVMLILRGVPGSGKSTLVHTIVEGFPESLVCSADHYFEKENGEYVFDGNLLKDAHADCQRRARDAMSRRVPLVVIDNTCVKHWEYKKYEAMAEEAGYQVLIVSLECDSIPVNVLARLLAARNAHQVPEATILNMLRNWYPDERSFKMEIRGLPESDETATVISAPNIVLTVEFETIGCGHDISAMSLEQSTAQPVHDTAHVDAGKKELAKACGSFEDDEVPRISVTGVAGGLKFCIPPDSAMYPEVHTAFGTFNNATEVEADSCSLLVVDATTSKLYAMPVDLHDKLYKFLSTVFELAFFDQPDYLETSCYDSYF